MSTGSYIVWLVENFSLHDRLVPLASRAVCSRRVDEVKHCLRISFHQAFRLVSAEKKYTTTPVAAGRERRGICLRAPAEGAPKGGAVFLGHETYANYVSFVEAGMGIK